MLQNILNLDGVTVLNKKQQNSVNGGLSSSGGTCSYIMRKYESDGSYYEFIETGVSKTEAVNASGYASENWSSGNWCCDSCGSASWL